MQVGLVSLYDRIKMPSSYVARMWAERRIPASLWVEPPGGGSFPEPVKQIWNASISPEQLADLLRQFDDPAVVEVETCPSCYVDVGLGERPCPNCGDEW